MQKLVKSPRVNWDIFSCSGWEKYSRKIQNAIILKLMKENENCMLPILFQSLTKQQHNFFFNMPSFSSNYLLNSSSETVNCCTQLLRYFGLSFNQTHFQRLHSCVWWATVLSFQHEPNTEVHGLRSGDEEALILCSKTAGNCLCTKLGFCWRFEREHGPVCKWNLRI